VRRLLGDLYGALAAARVTAYRRGLVPSHRLAGPVISVGNLSVGGSGKTPVVARLAELLRAQGLPVSVLSRGYRGSFRGDALVVGDGHGLCATAAEAGDEPVMLARALAGVVVAVGPRRDAVGRAVEARFGPRVHLLDDGFQHLRLARDLDLLCLSPEDLGDRPLPAGRLRENAVAARRADILLLTGAEDVSPARMSEVERSLGRTPTFRVRRRGLGFASPAGEAVAAPARPFLLAGIARPQRFAADVGRVCPTVVGTAFFRDHHAFSAADLEAVMSRARAAGADALVTTAKDAERLAPSDPAPSDPVLPLLVFRVAAEIDDEDRLLERLLAAVRRHPAFAAARAEAGPAS
jgi:tetraacyldisaccharide 4'-kinase